MTNVKDDEKEFSKQFVDECDREIMKFLQEMEKKHGGLTYLLLFHYSNFIQMQMLDGYLDVQETLNGIQGNK